MSRSSRSTGKRSGRNVAVRAAVITGLVAAALGITVLAAVPHLKGRPGPEKEVSTAGESLPEETPAAAEPAKGETADTTPWKSSGKDDLIEYNGRQYRYNSHLSNYLFLGIDTDGDIMKERETVDGGQSDAIYLLSYDRKEETARVLSIPRDTMTTIQIYDRGGQQIGAEIDHITLQYAYGDGKEKSCRLTMDAVSNLLYGTPILGYAAINTDSIPLLADVVDGVTLTVPDDSLEKVYPEFAKGREVTLDTENAEKFLRYRDTEQHQQALVRMERQKAFIYAFVEKVKTLQKQDPHTVTDIYQALRPHMVTNMTNDIFLDLVTSERQGSIETIPGEGVDTDLYDEYHVDEDALYEMILDVFYVEET